MEITVDQAWVRIIDDMHIGDLSPQDFYIFMFVCCAICAVVFAFTLSIVFDLLQNKKLVQKYIKWSTIYMELSFGQKVDFDKLCLYLDVKPSLRNKFYSAISPVIDYHNAKCDD